MAESNNGEITDVSCYSDFPVRHLRQRARNILSRYLNVNLRGRNWMDVASEMEYDDITILNWEREQDPMGYFLRDWGTKESSTVGKLINVLEDLGRHDAISEIKKPVGEDYKLWRRKERKRSPLQMNNVTPSQRDYSVQRITEELRGMTTEDLASGPIEIFDAYVCFCKADNDIVNTMIRILEKPPYNLKLCVEFRDLVPGCQNVTAEAELIINRCKRMVVILSPDFIESKECGFQAKIALSYCPDARAKYVIPVMYKQCTLPPVLRNIVLCDFTKKDEQEWFWERLYCALNLR
ncbi:myeloid differentiation primary response protein MyD88-like [Ptychodera flava]|uniref:myeloid differentiation primary response protein MyD88-like n=1 Tax=Ptychodera flava TaxID=63121 RepID=UPI00396A3C1F